MTTGIHHITAIASDAKLNLEFYTKTLGLRLVKKTVNQDDTSTYHLFYGDKEGHPGMDLTFFIFLPPRQGYPGNGQVSTISLAVPQQAISFWHDRLKQLNVKQERLAERFGNPCLVFYDPDDQRLALVGVDFKDANDISEIWTTTAITVDQAIRHFHSANLQVPDLRMLVPVLTQVFGYKLVAEADSNYLFKASDSSRAAHLEVHVDPSLDWGIMGAGTVHHIAFRAKNEAHQAELRSQVLKLGLRPTAVIDRFYFKSVYFQTPGGILFEIATDSPGFTADEPAAKLGQKLALPPFLEPQRTKIEKGLTPI